MASTLHGSSTAEDIAVVGLACLFPGAPDIGTFWRNIVAKVSAITSPPPEAWDDSLYYDPTSDENDRVYCKKGGYLGPLAYFDPLEHGIMPRAVEGGEPDQWLALHVGRQALRDAGYLDGVPQRARAAVILGKGNYANRGTITVVYHGVIVDYTLQLLKSIQPELTDEDLRRVREDLKRHLPRFDAETAPALISNVAVGRIANRLDLTGPSYTIDAACASSLLAVDAAVKGLRHGEYDLALVGGMQVATPVPVLSLFCRLNALSRSESIRPFDKDADGTLLSEGVGMAVLKRRSDAERDGHRIYAYVKGTGVASDGRAVSVLAPRVEGEELAVRLAYDGAEISPESVGLLEAHGTATLVGDATEIEALGRVFGERRGQPRCALGSVKSMIGHTMPAAGMAGFIKTVLALYQKVLPATLGVTEPSPRLNLERTPFYINTETRPWIHGDRQHARRAGVNAFGFGGINAHVILEEAPVVADSATHETAWDSEVCLFAGLTRAEIIEAAEQVIRVIRHNPAVAIADVAFSLNMQFQQMPVRPVVLAVVAVSVDDFGRKLERAVARLLDPACRQIKEVNGIYFFEEQLAGQGRLAFLFPGEGAQYVNMLGDLCRHFPQVRHCFDEMDRHFAHHPRGYVLSDFVFPPPAFSDAERALAERRLVEMEVAVEAVHTANQALLTLLTAFDIRPDAIVGHSTGEYSAMRAAGMLDEQTHDMKVHELNTIHRGATAAGRVPADARLFAVGAARDRVAAVCASLGESVSIAMDNCRHQVILTAPVAVASKVEAAFRAEGLLYETLAFDRPYHTPLFAEFAGGLRAFLESVIVRPASVPVYSATTSQIFPPELSDIHQIAYEHWLRPVEFRQTIEQMHADGIRIFVEVGPRGNLTSFVDDILAGRCYTAIPANVSRRSGITQLNHLLAQLAAHGVPFNFVPLYRQRRLNPIDFAAPVERLERGSAPALARVKIPTGAPELGLSPDVIALIRARTQRARVEQAPSSVAAAPRVPPVTPVSTMDPAGSMKAPSVESAMTRAKHDDASIAGVGATAPGRTDITGGSGTVATDTTAHVMSAFFGTMQQFLTMQQQLMGSALGERTSDGHSMQTIRLRLLESLVAYIPGQSLVGRCTLDTARFRCLLDHTLGRNVSVQDPDLRAFPIVPFTLMTEIMAEAGVLLEPGRILTELRDVRANHWVAVDRGPVVLEVRAQRKDNGEVAVRLLQVEDASQAPVAEGILVFADEYPAAPIAEPIDLSEYQPYRWPADRLYEEAMFHGPAFQGVLAMDGVGRDGAVATLAVLDRSQLIVGIGSDDLVTDFVVLDLPGQVVGFWASQFVQEGFVILPFQMESLKLYGGMRPIGERMTCVARIVMPHPDRIRARLDVVGADGHLWARFDGWEDRRFDVPPAAVQLLLKPATAALSRPWKAPIADDRSERFVARRLERDAFPPDWLTSHGGLWSRVLVAAVLSRRERAHWHALRLPPVRRNEWLLGRIAAKDAVRQYAQQYLGVQLRPADVEVLPDKHGRPVVEGAWTRGIGPPPLVSISHSEGGAVALAGAGERLVGVGVDLERVGRMRPTTERVAFTDRELQFLDKVDLRDREAWALRLWCAKEACAKATGRGFEAGLYAFAIRDVDPHRGAVSIRFEAPNQEGADLLASTAQDGQWIFATCAATAIEGIYT
jgi:acyl transferase domain-containing protein/phosphopantetheinyl transferase